MNNPQRYNNPFALKDDTPSPWKGLIGKRPNGFLIFDTPTNGARAGFINLVNAYLNRGLNTIEKIFPVYAPIGDGSNNPEVYIKRVVSLTGIKRNQIITSNNDIYKIGKAIVTHEEGKFWMTTKDFDNAFNLAFPSNKIASPIIPVGIVFLILFTLIFFK